MLGKKMNKKLGVLTGIIALAAIILIIRLTFLQIIQGQEFVQKAESNRIRLNPIAAPRGVFYDRKGKVLVKNRAAFTISIVPMDLKDKANEVVRKLSQILAVPESDIWKKLKEKQGTSFDSVRIMMDAGSDVVVAIEERRNELPGVIIETDAIRDYPYGDWGSLLFGYVGEINAEELKDLKTSGYRSGDIIGKIGLEKVYDKYLRGTDGGRQVEVNALGLPVRELGVKPPRKGSDIILTIDQRIQDAAEQAIFEKYGNGKGVGAIAMDPNTGEVLALVSKPGFDPNKFAGGISSADYLALVQNPLNPFRNRVIQNAYPPGSVFKVITGTAALERKKTSDKEMFYDPGYYPPLPMFSCWYKPGHRSIDIVNGYAQSCNVVFYTLGDRVGIDAITKYEKMYGLGEKTGIELQNEEKGLAPSREWKKKAFKNSAWGQNWFKGETLNISIGQGYHLYTPIQIVRMLSAVVNGGKVFKPYLVREIRRDGKLVRRFTPVIVRKVNVSPETTKIVKAGLRAVVEKGTAKLMNIPNVTVAGKTGTAQAPRGEDHAWFACYAPADKPKIAIVVFVEHGGHGGTASAPIALSMIKAAFNIGKPATTKNPSNQQTLPDNQALPGDTSD